MKASRPLSFFLVIFSSFFLFACGKTEDLSINQDASPSVTLNLMNPDQNATTSADNGQNSDLVAINTKYGQIVIKLFSDSAPNTVANFLSKANSGFYNGLTFHRVEPGFVVQGGDPLGNGTGGGTIVSEINDVPFVRGSVGLARGGIKEQSNDSQFFICLSQDTCQHLSNEYVNFGEVLQGMDIVDQIRVADKIISASSKTK